MPPPPPPPAPPPPPLNLIANEHPSTAFQTERLKAFRSSAHDFNENNKKICLDVTTAREARMMPGRRVVQRENSSGQIIEETRESPVQPEKNARYLSIYRAPNPVLQAGPRCGFVALAMAADILLGTSCSDKELVRIARSKGFTKQGEMFSAVSMCDLVNEQLGCTARMINLGESYPDLIEELLHGGVVLVPYDSDGNHEPCLKRGHKAHWALLTGCLIPIPASVERIIPETMLLHDPMCPNLVHYTGLYDQTNHTCSDTFNGSANVSPMSYDTEQTCCKSSESSKEHCFNSSENVKMQIDTDVRKSDLGQTADDCKTTNKSRTCNQRNICCSGRNDDNSECFSTDCDMLNIVTSFYTESMSNRNRIFEDVTELHKHLSTLDPQSIRVFAHHGKSRHVGTWGLDTLIASNDNLVEVNPDMLTIQDDYVIPSGGIVEGLCGKAVLVRRLSEVTEDV